MISLTKQERLVLVFLVIVIMAGSLLHWAVQKSGPVRQFFSVADAK